MDKRELQKAMLELMGENENTKKSEIPRNVDSSYKVILDLNMKGVAIVFLPFVTVLPVSLFILWIAGILSFLTGTIAVVVTIVLFTSLYGLLTMPAIKERHNLKLYHSILYKMRYRDRQKVFFREGKNKNA